MESPGANAATNDVHSSPSDPLAAGEPAEEAGPAEVAPGDDPPAGDAGAFDRAALMGLAEAVREVGPIGPRRWPAGFGVRAGAVLFDGVTLGFLTILIVVPVELVLSVAAPSRWQSDNIGDF